MKAHPLTLISHQLCPYVQRAIIALTEKGVDFERRDIDLTNKPGWFLKISPLGKTPVLLVGKHAIFESNVILEFLDETQVHALHPADPLMKADHRSWIEYGSSILDDIAGFYNAPDADTFAAKTQRLIEKFSHLETRLGCSLYFDDAFSLVDTVYGPVFRYFEVFDKIGNFGILSNYPKLQRWRSALAERPSIASAVSVDYPEKLRLMLQEKNSHLKSLM